MSFSASQAVAIICDKLNDPNKESYEDLAYDTFNQSISELMDAQSYKTEDVHGLVDELSETVPDSGIVDIEGETNKISNVEHMFCDPEATASSASNKIIKEVDLNFFNGLQGQSGFIDSDTVLAYRVGDLYKFYPKSQASDLEVIIVYTKYPNQYTSASADTDILKYFSQKFIYKAIELAAQKIIKERGTE